MTPKTKRKGKKTKKCENTARERNLFFWQEQQQNAKNWSKTQQHAEKCKNNATNAPSRQRGRSVARRPTQQSVYHICMRVPYTLRASIHKKVNIRSAKNIQKAKNKLKQNECKKTKNAQNATNCQEQRQYATQCNTTLRMASKCTVAKSNKMQESNGTQSTSITQLLAKIQQGTQ